MSAALPEKKLSESLMLLCVFVLTTCALVPVRGWALATLWGWFVVPIYQLAPLTWQQAWGLGVIVQWFALRPASLVEVEADERASFGRRCAHRTLPFFTYPAAIGTIWVIRQVLS